MELMLMFRSHMAIVVWVMEKRYLVDVGYGVDGPCCPLPLDAARTLDGLPDQRLKLEYQALPQHRDSTQRVWVYSQRRAPADWANVYHFPDVEFFPADMDVLNFFAMSQSLWARAVVAQRFIAHPEGPDRKLGSLSGTLLLFRNQLEKSRPSIGSSVETISSEVKRIKILEEHFGIHLAEQEVQAIQGRESEIRCADQQ
jgi:arylamine N-acetyltransferase